MRKPWIILILIVALLLGIGGGVVYTMTHYVYAGGSLYPIGTEALDLREETLSLEDYHSISEKLPGCDILWKVPFQGGTISSDTKAVTIKQLSGEDMQALLLLPELKTVNADGCTDYALLAQLQEALPDCTVDYTISIGGRRYTPDLRQLELTELAAEDIALLPFFSGLEALRVSGCEDYEALKQLGSENPQWNLTLSFSMGGQEVTSGMEEISVTGATFAELQESLPHLLSLKRLHLTNPQADARQLAALREQYPHVDIRWEVTLFEMTFAEDITEVDISGNIVEDLSRIEALMACLPDLEKLIMSDCGIDNETMAEFRERQRENYKVVWTVYLSDKTKCRTDDIYFMPIQQGEYYLLDEHTPNLKYCEDMICIDVGHHAIHNIDFVAYMPHLKYLILAHTQVQDISPIANCKELIYLELDWSIVRDLTPLLECTALEDLNLNETFCDKTPLLQMTWLKNLWVPGAGYKWGTMLTEALPDTLVVTQGVSPTGQGWRNLPNYYAMRDVLGMYYMK